MLGSCSIVAFVGISDAERAVEFYRDKLGLRLVSQDQFAAVFDAGGTMLRVTPAGAVKPATHTVLGWQVININEVIDGLREHGVDPVRYSFLKQDDRGVWTSPSGSKVAWFHDPDGNILSLTKF